MNSHRIRILLLPCVLLLLAAASQAQVLRGRVVSVIDGDTLTVLDAQNHKHLVRLSGIDAPERGQNHSKQSRLNLRQLVWGKEVTVEFVDSKRGAEIIARVTIAEADGNLDVGLAQIKAGYAWCESNRFLNETRYSIYRRAEDEARDALLGLWQEPRPTPPWDFRKMQREEAYYESVPHG